MRKLLLASVLPVVAVLAPAGAARADTVTLVSGEKVEGVIKRETQAEVTMEVKVSAGITDERTMRRDEIAKIEKVPADELAYAEIRNIKPDPQRSYAPETYERILAALKNFQTKYPRSPHIADVQLDIDVFEKEKERVDAGEVKYLSQWLSKEEAERRLVQIQGLAQFGAMQAQAARNDIMGALLTFEQLENARSNTRAYPDAVDLARQLLPRLLQEVKSRARTLAYQDTEFQKEVSMVSEPRKSELTDAYRREQAQFDAAIAAAKSSSKWPPLMVRSAKSLDAVQKTAEAEIGRLATVNTQKMRDSIILVDQARTAIGLNDLKEADSLLQRAVSLWSQNEAATYWGDRLKALQAAAAATPTPSKSPSPLPAASPSAAPQPSAKPAAKAAAAPLPAIAENTEHGSFLLSVPGILTVVGIAAVIVGGMAVRNRAKAAADEANSP